VAGPAPLQQATIDWRRAAADKNVAVDVARGLWEQAKAAQPSDDVARSTLFRRLLEDAAKNPGASQEPGKANLVDTKGPQDPSSLGPGKTTQVLLNQNQPSGAKPENAPQPAAAPTQAPGAPPPTAPGADAAKEPPTAKPTVDKLRDDLVSAAQASHDAAALLAIADPATIMEALRQLREGSPTILQKVITAAGAAIERRLGNVLPDPETKPDGPPGIKVPIVAGDGEVLTHSISDAGVPMISAATVAQKIGEWRADILKREPADQQEVMPNLARATTLDQTAGDQAKKTKLGDEPSKAALPDTQRQLGATLGTVSRQVHTAAQKPATPPAPTATAQPDAAAVAPGAPANANEPTPAAQPGAAAAAAPAATQPGAAAAAAPAAATPAAPAAAATPAGDSAPATAATAPAAAGGAPAAATAQAPDSASGAPASTGGTAPAAATAQAADSAPAAPAAAGPAGPTAGAAQAAGSAPAAASPAVASTTTTSAAASTTAAAPDATAAPAAAPPVPLAYEAYATHVRTKFAGDIGELTRMAADTVASGANLKRASQRFELTLEQVSKLKADFNATKAQLDEKKRRSMQAQIAAQESALPNAGLTMPQLLEKAKELIQRIEVAGEAARSEKTQLEGVMNASIMLGMQIDPVAGEKGRDLYFRIDTQENPALVAQARAAGMPEADVAAMAVNHRNWLRQFVRTEVMQDQNHAEILFLRDLGLVGARTGLTIEQVMAKVIAKLQKPDPETKQAALSADFKLEMATPAELDQIYAGVIGSAGTTNAGVNANSGAGASATTPATAAPPQQAGAVQPSGAPQPGQAQPPGAQQPGETQPPAGSEKSKHAVGAAPANWRADVAASVPSEQVVSDDPGHTYHVLKTGKGVATSKESELNPAMTQAAAARAGVVVTPEAEPPNPQQAPPGLRNAQAIEAAPNGTIIGNPLQNVAEGHGVLSTLSQGNPDGLARVGVGTLPFEANRIEWGLDQWQPTAQTAGPAASSNVFRIVKGDESGVQVLPDYVRHGHSHPTRASDITGTEQNLQTKTAGNGSMKLNDLLRLDWPRAFILPSASDFHWTFQHNVPQHIVHTPYQIDPTTQEIFNPSKMRTVMVQQGQPLAFVIDRSLFRLEQMSYTGILIATAGGAEIWRGQFTAPALENWGAASPSIKPAAEQQPGTSAAAQQQQPPGAQPAAPQSGGAGGGQTYAAVPDPAAAQQQAAGPEQGAVAPTAPVAPTASAAPAGSASPAVTAAPGPTASAAAPASASDAPAASTASTASSEAATPTVPEVPPPAAAEPPPVAAVAPAVATAPAAAAPVAESPVPAVPAAPAAASAVAQGAAGAQAAAQAQQPPVQQPAPATPAPAPAPAQPHPLNISPTEEAALKAQQPDLRTPVNVPARGGPADALVKDNAASPTNPEGVSAAANPEFEKEALTFEKALGRHAYGHGIATAAIDGIASQCIRYLTTFAGEWSNKSQKLEAVLHEVGIDHTTYVGAVGKEINAVMAAFEMGSMHEKWIHILHFFEHHLITELAKEKAAWDPKFQEACQEANMDFQALKSRRDDVQGPDGKVDNSWKLVHWDTMKDQWHTRVREPGSDGTLGKTAGELGVPMSEAEQAHQKKAAQGEGDDFEAATKAPKWHSGSKGWFINERDKWVRRQREMSLPLAAGPSGHTTVMMNAGTYFKTDPYSLRLAAIGNLLVFGHHTLVEVLTAAAAFGPTFTPGQMMYTNIKPLGPDELKALGKGKFPHEPRSTSPTEPEKK
jgi:hypothetical protein